MNKYRQWLGKKLYKFFQSFDPVTDNEYYRWEKEVQSGNEEVNMNKKVCCNCRESPDYMFYKGTTKEYYCLPCFKMLYPNVASVILVLDWLSNYTKKVV